MMAHGRQRYSLAEAVARFESPGVAEA